MFVTWIAEHGVGDEDGATFKMGSTQEGFEVAAGLVGEEWYAPVVGSEASRGFGDEEYLCLGVAVGLPKHSRATFHAWAHTTALHQLYKLSEYLVLHWFVPRVYFRHKSCVKDNAQMPEQGTRPG